MSIKCVNICFIIILVTTSLFSIDGYIFESSAAFFHKLLLANNTTKTDEFSFTFSRDPACTGESWLIISFGSAKSGSSLISFKFNFKVLTGLEGQVLATITAMADSSMVNSNGKEFVITFKSCDKFKLQAVGNQKVESSDDAITEFSFDKFNSTHLGITFYAWFTEKSAQRCSFHFDFPDYEVLKGKTILPTTTMLPTTLPSEEPTQQPIKTTNTALPEKFTSTSQKTTTPSKNTSTTTENTSISSTAIYIAIGVSTLVLGILISAVTSYFVLSKLSYFKPTENDKTKFDAEKTKITAFKAMPDKPAEPISKPSGTSSFSSALKEESSVAAAAPNDDGKAPPRAKTPTIGADGFYEDVTIG